MPYPLISPPRSRTRKILDRIDGPVGAIVILLLLLAGAGALIGWVLLSIDWARLLTWLGGLGLMVIFGASLWAAVNRMD